MARPGLSLLEATYFGHERVNGAALDQVGRAKQLGRAGPALGALARERGERLVKRAGGVVAARLGLRPEAQVLGSARRLRRVGRTRRAARRHDPNGQLHRSAHAVEGGGELSAPALHRARHGGLVVEPRAVPNRQQVAIRHQGLDDLLVMPERLGRELGLARGRADGGKAVEGHQPEPRHVRQRRARVVGDGVELDHSASPMRGSSCLSCAVATELISARSCT